MRLCKVLGLEALTRDADYATAAARSKNRAPLNRLLAERLAGRTSREWVDAVAGHVPVYFSVFNTSLAQIKATKSCPAARRNCASIW